MGAPANGEQRLFYCLFLQMSTALSPAELSSLATSSLRSLVCETGHIWQHEIPAFTVVSVAHAPRPPLAQHRDSAGLSEVGFHPYVISGSFDYGDNVEDAWLVTQLLMGLTQQQAGVALQVWDSDGQFLLIEAAEVLPRWVTPRTSVDRALVFNGQLHLVRPPVSPAELGRLPAGQCTLPLALKAVVDPELDTLAPQAVRRVLAQRLDAFPARARENVHRCRMLLPAAALEVWCGAKKKEKKKENYPFACVVGRLGRLFFLRVHP